MAGPVQGTGGRRGRTGFESRVSPYRGPDRLTEYERKICHAVDRGLGDRAVFREVRPLSAASDDTARRTVWSVRQRPHCRAYLAELKARSLARHLDAKDRLIEELAAAAFASLGDFLTDGSDGLALRPLAQLSHIQLRGLRAVTITHSAHGRSVRLALHDKLAAIGKLCRLLGLDAPDRAKTGARDAVAQMSDVERAQRLAAILRLADQTAEDGAAVEGS